MVDFDIWNNSSLDIPIPPSDWVDDELINNLSPRLLPETMKSHEESRRLSGEAGTKSTQSNHFVLHEMAKGKEDYLVIVPIVMDLGRQIWIHDPVLLSMGAMSKWEGITNSKVKNHSLALSDGIDWKFLFGGEHSRLDQWKWKFMRGH